MKTLGLVMMMGLGLTACSGSGGGSGESLCDETANRLTTDCGVKTIPTDISTLQSTGDFCIDGVQGCIVACYLGSTCDDVNAYIAGTTSNVVGTCITACKAPQ